MQSTMENRIVIGGRSVTGEFYSPLRVPRLVSLNHAARRPRAGNRRYRVAKRAFDIVFSSCVVVAGVGPGLLLSAAVAWDTRSFPLYAETRVGHAGPFKCLKFRTMVADSDNLQKYLTDEQIAQWNEERKVEDDPRVTSFGRVLRSTSLDETPQFLNVLAGHMSVVGPRALTQWELDHHFDDEQRAAYLSAPSGITGAWQVGPRNEATFADGRRQEVELAYVRNASLKEDARIILATIGTVLVRRNGM